MTGRHYLVSKVSPVPAVCLELSSLLSTKYEELQLGLLGQTATYG